MSKVMIGRPYVWPAQRRELLPFRVRLAEGPQDLAKAVEIRAAAYARHLPHVAQELRVAELEDSYPDVLLLIAERKFDGRAIGSMRLEPNFTRPLHIESQTSVLDQYRGKRLVETTRLGVEHGNEGTMVMAALAKGAFEICHACAIDYNVAVARRSMLRVFESLCYDVIGGPIPISYAFNASLWILSIPILEVETRLRTNSSAHFDFLVLTEHPDIAIDFDRVQEVFGMR